MATQSSDVQTTTKFPVPQGMQPRSTETPLNAQIPGEESKYNVLVRSCRELGYDPDLIHDKVSDHNKLLTFINRLYSDDLRRLQETVETPEVIELL